MAIFPCENKSLCLDPANPFQNFSAEAADKHIYISRYTGFGPSYPPLGSDFFQVGCTVFCESTVSQEDADLCAARSWVDCLSVNWPVWRPGVDVFGNPVAIPGRRPVFLSQAQTATVFCPDGNPFSYTLAAGRYASFNQDAANAAALSDAQNLAEENKLCISELTVTKTCSTEEYSASVTATGAFVNAGTACWSIIGNLPPGIESDLALSPGCQTGSATLNFFGTPTVPGFYSFAIQVEDDRGNFMVKPVTMQVIGITTTSLPDGTPFIAYSETVDADGVTNPIFTLESGTLPLGLALDAGSGVIFGTPIQAEMQSFVISVTEAGTGITCFGPELSITIAGAGINFNDAGWDPPFSAPEGPGGTANGTSVGNTINASCSVPVATGINSWTSNVFFQGTIPYTGDLTACNVNVVIASTNPDTSLSHCTVSVDSDIDGNLLSIDVHPGDPADWPFNVPASVGAIITITVLCGCSSINPPDGPNSVTATVTLTPAF